MAEVVHRALTARKPRRKYLVGKSARAMALLRWLPQPLIDSIFTRMV